LSVYVDSGVLIKLYVREPNSDMAALAIQQHELLPLNGLLELEVRNTLRALEARESLTDVQRAAAEHFFEIDCAEGRLHRTAVDWTEVFQRSIGLSHSFTGQTLARSLDVLHVAVALHQKCSLFITADKRQAAFARCCNLPVELLE